MSTSPSPGSGTGSSTSSSTSGPPNSRCWMARMAPGLYGALRTRRVCRLMSVTVVGSIAFDAVKTPSGSRDRLLGGAATHFSLAASFFDEVRPVGPVGDDFGPEDLAALQTRGTITDDVEHVPGGRTFFWAGEYTHNLNVRETLDTQLTGRPTVVGAAQELLSWGLKAVVSKHGKYGAALFTDEGVFALPAYPLEMVVDPTGAGDSFAGGFVGYVAAPPDEPLGHELFTRAMAYGTALASFNVEEFGTERVARLTRDEISERTAELHRMTQFELAPLTLRG